MSISFERLWVTWLNSERWRRIAKYGPGSKVLRSRAYQKATMVRRYATTYYQSHRNPELFQDIKTFCVFIGHAKSGSTLVSALLDAHPKIIFADEADVLKYVSSGFSRDQIYHILLKGSRREALKGRVTARRLQPYSFLVPGQWQGRYSKLQIIGDSRAGPSTGKLSRDPDLLQRLRETMVDVDLKLFHIVRNPFDPISLMMIRGKRTFDNAINHYFTYCATLAAVREQTRSSELLTIRYEDFIIKPDQNLGRIFDFLEVEPGDDYLKACIGILYKSPEQSRQLVEWDSKWIDIVQQKIAQFEFLHGYSFDD